MSQNPISILICGAGVVGTALDALALARHPTIRPKPIITMLVRFEALRATGQGIDIRGPAASLLHREGTKEKVRARHTTAPDRPHSMELAMVHPNRGGVRVCGAASNSCVPPSQRGSNTACG
jgi:2-polyprenyl-6-methoxyphenol hydroxylase-like FAD-dependent oxidoreductase